ncbi:hypothetical protein [Shimazuella soli]|uniref:hypothetical protein n=1 Tax=Shimazuella soli TaxID=1892854 RepID=UPI001F0FC6D8|nr:hypothetical protein [Shimazuella soli]
MRALALAFLLGAVLLAFGAFHRSQMSQSTRSAVLLDYAAYSVQQDDDNVDGGYLVLKAANNRPDTSWNLTMRIICGVGSACSLLMAVVLFVRS